MRANSTKRFNWLGVAGLAVFALAAGAFVWAAPGHWANLTQPTPLIRAHLAALNWPVQSFAALTFGTEVAFTLGFYLLGLVIFIRRPGEAMAVYTALMLAAMGVANNTMTRVLEGLWLHPQGALVAGLLGFIGWAAFTNFIFVFPSGRYVPAWAWLPGLVWGVVAFGWNLLPGSAFDPTRGSWYGLVSLGLFICLGYSMIYRFTRVSGPIERQQIKWVWYGALMVMAWELIWLSVRAVAGNQLLLYVSGTGGEPPTPEVFAIVRVAQMASRLFYLAVPLTLAIAILRYRLWDIDLIIRRTLVYSALTGLLALAYFGSVVILQSVFQGLSAAGDSPLVIVLSTLLIAALFVPVRAWVQRAIDRAFYRRKYDAARTLAAFAEQARDEVDLARLSASLRATVENTMQPASIELWLRRNPE